MDSTTHITAYLTGGWPDRTGLGVHYARVMAAALARYAPQAEFTVFTDQALPGINTRPIPALSGFFGRLYQFSPEAFPRGTRVLSLDLDTAILGDLTPILTMDLSQIVGLGAFGPRHDWARPLMGNGLMSWIAGPKYWPLWLDFPKGFRGTDETWTRSALKDEWRWVDELVPNAVMSYGWDMRRAKRPITPDTRIVYFYGVPRPHQINETWNPLYLTPANGKR